MMKNILSIKFHLLTLLSISIATLASNANNISKDQMIDDITQLASDEMNGRQVFTADIDNAAEYISGRFSKIGLVPMHGEKTFKQTFNVLSVKPQTLTMRLNDQEIPEANLAMTSTIRSIDWNSGDDFKTTVVGESDDMRAALRAINNEGGKHVILLHSSQSAMFARYQGFFKRGSTKLSLEHQGAIVIALTDVSSVEKIMVKATTTISKKSLTNVIGIIPGKTKPEEIVLYSAHYDHLGNKTGIKPGNDTDDLIFNGADDDASGTSAVISLAEYFKGKSDNARTLMFTAFTAEEIGGFGSRYFSEQLNADDVVAMINVEMIGKPSKFGEGAIWMTGMDRSNLGELLNEGLKGKGFEIHQDPYPKQRLFYRSDNATLARLGVPAHSFSSTQLDKDEHYHKASDDVSSLNMDSMHQAIESLSIATQGLVDGLITPTRIDKAEVRSGGKIY
jgi:aminopeptidase YwaD